MSHWRQFIEKLITLNLIGPLVLVSLAVILITLPFLANICFYRSPDPVSFEALCGLAPEEFATMDESKLVQWIEARSGMPPSKDTKLVGPYTAVYSWTHNDTLGSATFSEGHLHAITIEYQSPGPPFCQVVERLGAPETVVADLYRGVTGGNWYSLELEYPEHNLVLTASDFSDWYYPAQAISRRSRVDRVHCYEPGSLNSALYEEIQPDPCDDTPIIVHRRIPWPGFGGKVSFACEP
jgi:hypothetical protein